jgi:hypothetical protein
MSTWAGWDDAVPGFVQIDLAGHERGVAWGEFCFTLTVTDIATGWTVNPSGRAKWVFEALEHVVERFPLPILGSTPICRHWDSSSSTSTCSPGGRTSRSPSPGPALGTRPWEQE